MGHIALKAEKRDPGKSFASRLRKSGRIPGILYGKGAVPLSISVDRRELDKAVKTKAGMNAILDLSVVDGDSGLVLIRDYQADPFKRDFVHVDFQTISLSEKIEVEVPILLIGQPIGVKEGGVIEQLRRMIHIRSLPERIPDKIEVDISNLKIGDSIHADEVKLPDGVEFPHVLNYTIVAIVPPAKEEVVAAPVPTAEVPVEGAPPAEATTAAAETPAATVETKGGEKRKE